MAQVECPSTGLEAPIGWTEAPEAWLACVLLGLVLSLSALWPRWPLPARAAAFITGQTIALTAPLAGHLDRFVIGRFPTTDKYGSLAFYLDGAHRRLLLDPAGSLDDPAARLIGVHMGHLWVTEFFDLWMTPEGAMNLQGLLYPILAWGSASLLFRTTGARPELAILMAFPYGMGLHLFRDLNCYTIEKSAIFWIPLFATCLWRAHQRGGLWIPLAGGAYLLMSWMNLYLGAVAAVLAALITLPVWGRYLFDLARGTRRPIPSVAWSLAWCVLLSLPLLAWQHMLSSGPEALGSPEEFKIRAELDSLSLWPLEWNRLSWWSALSPVAIVLGLIGAWTVRREPLVQAAGAAFIVLTLLSLGPWIGSYVNPADWLAREWIPGYWRTAEPESFFHASWLLLLGAGALGLSRLEIPRWGIPVLYMVMVGVWLIAVRGHAEFPSMSQKTEVYLSDGWEQKVFGRKRKGPN